MKEFIKYLDWVIYQIYPKSFCDSDGDGIGDLAGITEKLDYIKDLGVNAIWLCPIFKSPQCDNGYDISDYRDIEPVFGTMRDFENLVANAKKRDIKIILDLVANHTSSEHFWFKEARKSKDNPYHDYYYWAKKPLNDWTDQFGGGSAWEYNEQTDEYYLHSFAVGQPDVNWDNPKVRQEFCDIVDFWIDKGVDGFRCDVLHLISKDFKNDLKWFGPHFHEYVNQLFGREKSKNLFTVGECYVDEKQITELCGEGRGELKSSFQFDHIFIGSKGRFAPIVTSMNEVVKIFDNWEKVTQKLDVLYPLFTDNHDQPWYNSKFGNDGVKRFESATALATMFFLGRGVPFIYQGQEVGFANSEYGDISAFDDIETLNFYKASVGKIDDKTLYKDINFGSRDNSRRPFAWNGEQGFGFTSAEKPWLPYATRSDRLNVESDLKNEKSVIKYYRDLLKLRKEVAAFRYGQYKSIYSDDGFIAYLREYDDEKYLVVCNFAGDREVDLGFKNKKLILTNNNAILSIKKDRFAQYDAAVYKILDE